MNGDLFLACAERTGPLLAGREVAGAWEAPSSLREMTVAALSGHLFRAVATLDAYLGREAPAGDGETIDAAGYFLSLEGLTEDIDSELHRSIRTRAEEEAIGGHPHLVERWEATVARLRTALSEGPGDRRLAVLGGRAMLLSDYLVTRMVELVVHGDDLAVSVGMETPRYPEEAWRLVEECLVEVARRRHGHRAVVRALARRERDDVEALRVL